MISLTAAVSRICSGRLAPQRADATPGREIVHATASWATEQPAASAIGRSRSTASRFSPHALAREQRRTAPPVVLGEDVVPGELARQQPKRQRLVGDDRHVVSAAPRQDVRFGLALEHVVADLARDNRALGGEGLDFGHRQVRHADRPRLALGQHVAKHAGRFGDRRVVGRGVEVEQIDVVQPQPREALVEVSSQQLGPAGRGDACLRRPSRRPPCRPTRPGPGVRGGPGRCDARSRRRGRRRRPCRDGSRPRPTPRRSPPRHRRRSSARW